MDHLKTQFYRAANEAVDQLADAVDDAAEAKDQLEEQFKELLAEYKTKRAAVAAQEAEEQQANLARKQAILDEMAKMVESNDAEVAMANLQRMRELQAEWKSIG